MIVKVKDFISENQIDTSLEFYSTEEPVDGKITAGEDVRDYKSSTLFWPEDLKDVIMNTDTVKTIEDNVTASKFKVNGLHLVEYNIDDCYDWHVDNPVSNIKYDIPVPRLNKIGFTIWLNNPDDYDGGELVIKTENGVEEIKPKKGCCIFYPSSYMHKINKITNGTRRVIVGWLDCWYSNPKDRHLLIELNKSITFLHSLGDEKLKDTINTLRWTRQQIQTKLFSH